MDTLGTINTPQNKLQLEEQQKLYNEVAKHLLTKGAYSDMPSAAQMVLPGTWKYGAGDLISKLIGDAFSSATAKGAYQNENDLIGGKPQANPQDQANADPTALPQPQLSPSAQKYADTGTMPPRPVAPMQPQNPAGVRTANAPPIPPEGMVRSPQPIVPPEPKLAPRPPETAPGEPPVVTGSLPPSPPSPDLPTNPITGEPNAPAARGPSYYNKNTGAFVSPEIGITDRTSTDKKIPYNNRIRDIDKVNGVIVHYDAANAEKLAKYGQRRDPARNNTDFGYHFAIDPDGAVSQNAPLNKITNHAIKNNQDKIGVVLTGIGGKNQPSSATEAQMRSLANLYGEISDQLPNVQDIKGHGDVDKGRKAGEGEKEAAYVKDIWKGREEVNIISELDKAREYGAPEAGYIPKNERGKMNLGGDPGAARPMSDEVKVAQAMPGLTSTPVNPSAPASPQNPERQGYQGEIPPAAPLESEQQLRARLRMAPPEERNRIIDEFQKRSGTQWTELPGGAKIGTTPTQGGGQPNTTFIAGKDIPFGPPELGLHIRQGPGGTYKIIGPDGGDSPFKTVNDVFQEWKRIQSRGESTKTLTAAATSPMAQAIEQGTNVGARLRTLNTMDSIVRTNKNLSMGPTSPFMVESKQFMENLWPGSTKGVHDEDVLNKLTSLLASESTQAVSAHRGTNFELQMFTRANPNLLQSREGMIMMMDLLKQEYAQHSAIGKLASKFQKEGRDPLDWADELDKFYAEHPLTIHRPDGKGGIQNVTTKRINTEKDLEGLESGTFFLDPKGREGRVP